MPPAGYGRHVTEFVVVCNKDQIGLVETGRGLCGIGEVNDGDVPVGDIADGFGRGNRESLKNVFCFGIQRPLRDGYGWFAQLIQQVGRRDGGSG